jgi:hypothetical protein
MGVIATTRGLFSYGPVGAAVIIGIGVAVRLLGYRRRGRGQGEDE